MPHDADRVLRSRPNAWSNRIRADVAVVPFGVHRSKPRVQPRLEEERHGTDALDGPAGLVRLEKDRDPVVRLERGTKELHRCCAVHDHGDLQLAGDGSAGDDQPDAWGAVGVKAEARRVAACAASLVRPTSTGTRCQGAGGTDPELGGVTSALGQHDAPVEAHLTTNAVERRLDTGRVGRPEAAERTAAAARRRIVALRADQRRRCRRRRKRCRSMERDREPGMLGTDARVEALKIRLRNSGERPSGRRGARRLATRLNRQCALPRS